MAAFERHSYSGDAADTTLSAGIDDTTLTVTCADLTGWPDGTGGDFFVIFEPGKTGEEKCLAASRSGNTITLRTRGVEGTAGSHAATTTTVRHGYSARDADEANNAVSQTIGNVSAKGSIIVASAANTFGELEIGSTGQALVVSGGTLAYGKPTLAESDITGLVTDLAGKLDVPDTAFALGSIPVGTGANTYDTLAAGSDGTVLTADSTADSGVSWTTPTSGLLAHTDYSAATKTIVNLAALTAIDSTNLTITFTAPSSGKVLVRASFVAGGNTSMQLAVGWLIHGGSTQSGRTHPLLSGSAWASELPVSLAQTITGLTAGTSYTLDLAGHTNGVNVSASMQNFTLEAWAA